MRHPLGSYGVMDNTAGVYGCCREPRESPGTPIAPGALEEVSMNRKILGTVFSAALAMAGVGYAQTQSNSPSSQNPASTSQSTSTSHAKTRTMTGEVKDYTAGKSLEVTTRGNRTQKFDLSDPNMTANIDPSVAVGTRVRIMESTDASGHKTLDVKPAGSSGKRSNPASTNPSTTNPSTTNPNR